MEYDLSFFTAYNQFYVKDKGTISDVASEKFWSEEAFADRLAINGGILGISTTSYGRINGKLCLIESPTIAKNLDRFDHVIEASLNLKSGIMQIVDCPNFSVELEIKLLPGIYKVRIYSMNLEIYSDEDRDDFYLIEVWRDNDQTKKVLKRWTK